MDEGGVVGGGLEEGVCRRGLVGGLPGVRRETWGSPSRGAGSNCRLRLVGRLKGANNCCWRCSSISMMAA